MSGVRFNDFATIVRGSIVEDEELEVLKRLGQNAIDAFWQVPCVIIVRRDDRDLWHAAGPHGFSVSSLVLNGFGQPNFTG